MVAVAHSGLPEIVAGAHRPALQQHATAQPLAGPDAGLGERVVPRRGPVAEAHRVGAGHAQADHRPVAAAELASRLRHPAEHRLEVERAPDGAGEIGEHLRLPTTALLVREEARALESERGLVGEGLRHLHRARVEDAAGGVAQGEHPDQAVLGEQGHREDGAVRRLLQVPAELGARLHARIGQHVLGGDGAPLPDREADRARARLPRRPPVGGGVAGARDRERLQPAGMAVEPVDDRRAPADQRAEALRDARAHHGGLEPLGEEAADAGEGARLLEAGALTLQQAGVVLLEPAEPGASESDVGRAPAVQRAARSHGGPVVEQGPGHG